MNRLIKTITLMLMIVGANISIFAVPPLSSIQKAKETVENARYQLPIQVSYGLMLTQVSYDSTNYTLVYRYHYIIPVAKPSNEAIKESKLGIIHMLKANPNSEDMQLLKAGITFHYNYYSEDGTFLYAIKLSASDFK